MQEDDEASSTVKSTITVSNYLELSSLLFCMKTTSITTISETCHSELVLSYAHSIIRAVRVLFTCIHSRVNSLTPLSLFNQLL